MKKILITGGAGFIGSALAKSLTDKKYIVHIFDLKKKIKKKNIKLKGCKLISGDISVYNTFKKLDNDYDIIYHLAAKTSSSMADQYPEECYTTNVIGTCLFSLWIKQCKPKWIIFSSSMSVYGKIANKISEEKICHPISTYGKSKLLGEKIIRDLKDNRTNIKILRLFNVYGPDQNFKNLKQGMLSIYLAQIFKKKRVIVTGSLQRYRDFIFIDDVVKALEKCINFKKYEIYNIGTGVKTKVGDIIKLIFKRLNLTSKNNIILKKSSAGDTWGSYADIKRAVSSGWSPKTNIDLGLKKTIINIMKF